VDYSKLAQQDRAGSSNLESDHAGQQARKSAQFTTEEITFFVARTQNQLDLPTLIVSRGLQKAI